MHRMSKRHRVQRLGRIGARELGMFKQQSGESVLLIEYKGKIYAIGEGFESELISDDIRFHIMRRGS